LQGCGNPRSLSRPWPARSRLLGCGPASGEGVGRAGFRIRRDS
jgi:hypothetical protein